MDLIPTPECCLDLLRKSGCSKAVIDHCKAVRDIAVRIALKAHADRALVEAGALLHDIGRCKTHGIRHAVEGAIIARKLRLPDSLVNIIERHIGAGIPQEEAERLGLPVKDYTPKTLEEKIVAHADNLIAGSQQQPIEKEIEKAVQKGFKEYSERLRSLHTELSNICGMNLNEI